jgi:glycosyltransferase involved in cell wall biosynthesis
MASPEFPEFPSAELPQRSTQNVAYSVDKTLELRSRENYVRRLQNLQHSQNPAGAGEPLSVGVTVDLEWSPYAGGHVKCWERFAEAAAAIAAEVDLTVYFIGATEREVQVAANARYVMLPPAFGTDWLPFVRTGAGPTDIAGYHRRLARRLLRHDVLHATHAFAFSRTAWRVARQTGRALVSSIHTDLATFTPVYTRRSLETLLGGKLVSHVLLDRLRVDRLTTRNVLRKERRILGDSRRILATSPADRRRSEAIVGAERVGRLRRGVDRTLFHPRHRDRDRLARELAIPPGLPVLSFVGRVDETKGVMTLVKAARRLLDQGVALQVLILGTGSAIEEVRHLLDGAVTLPGTVPQETVAWTLASSDLFVFPSRSETLGNVVLEAKAAALPVVISDAEATLQNIVRPGDDGVVVASDEPADWAEAIAALLSDPERRAAIGRQARQTVEKYVPDWQDVVKEDLLPAWRAAWCDATTARGLIRCANFGTAVLPRYGGQSGASE